MEVGPGGGGGPRGGGLGVQKADMYPLTTTTALWVAEAKEFGEVEADPVG